MRSSFEASKSVRRSKTSSDRPRSCGGVEIPVTATMEVLPPEPGSAASLRPGSADEAPTAQASKTKGKPSGGIGSAPRLPHAKGREKLSKCNSETSIRLSSTVLRHSSAEAEQPVFLTGVTAGMESEDPEVLAAIADAEAEMQRDAGGAAHIPSDGEWYPALSSSGGPAAAGTVKILRSDAAAKPAAVRYSAGSSQDTSSGRASRRSASRERASMRASASFAAAPQLQEPGQGRYAAASSSVGSEVDASLRDSITLGQPGQVSLTESDLGGPVAHGQPCQVSLTESDLGGPVAHGQPCQVSLTESDLGGPVAHGQPCQVSLSRDDSASGSAVARGGRGANGPEDSDELNPVQSHESEDVMNVLKGALERSRLAQVESSEDSSEEEGEDERLLRGSLALNPMQSPESSAASIGNPPAASAGADEMEISAENPLMASIPSLVRLQAAASGEGERDAAAWEVGSESWKQAEGAGWDEESERDSEMLDAMPVLQAEQQERRRALEGHVARLQEVKDEEGEQLVLFPSDFSALVQSLFQNKVGQDRTEGLDAEKRTLKGKQQAAPEEGDEEGDVEEEDAELRSGREKILKLDRILSKKTEKAEVRRFLPVCLSSGFGAESMGSMCCRLRALCCCYCANTAASEGSADDTGHRMTVSKGSLRMMGHGT
ncbi:hypothetical protein CYMTET_46027 [Cymbomonas tetramitiformis]|uniref:Fibrous sheath-interacting protein 1 n=1 Tax=Cymbomonas tetramitiformis TaxID=36881 RepID=A0AAE0BYT6_9CHLO|nr:hypothetical protein CYMTET_46027 [Cymbomonas tetramitiformis]